VLAVLLVAAAALGATSAFGAVGFATRAIVNRYLLLTMLAFIVLFPIYVTVVNSLLAPTSSGTVRRRCSAPPALNSYSSAWSDGHLAGYLFNSFSSRSCRDRQIITAVLAAYAFASSTSR